MLKRFMIGFVLGVGSMYWFIHHAEDSVTSANTGMQRSAAQYRDDKVHQAVDAETGSPRR